MTHSIKAGDRFRATAPNGDYFEGTAVTVVGHEVYTEFNYISARTYTLERLTTPLATEVGALYGPDKENSAHFLVRVDGVDSETSFPWFTNSPHKSWLSDKQAAELVQEREWVRRDEFGASLG